MEAKSPHGAPCLQFPLLRVTEALGKCLHVPGTSSLWREAACVVRLDRQRPAHPKVIAVVSYNTLVRIPHAVTQHPQINPPPCPLLPL